MPRRDPLILFGAFDRHNFGDLLLARCAARAAGDRPVLFAGLAERDLGSFGGVRTRTLDRLIAAFGGEAADFVHVGGEILTTSAWEATVMLETPEDAGRVIALHGGSAANRNAWAATQLGTQRSIPYVAGRGDLPSCWTVGFRSAGGVALPELPAAEREEVLRALAGATELTVRDARTLASLRASGLDARLAPDPASATPALFRAEIRERADCGEIRKLATRQGRWIAVQLAAHWGDDETLDRIAQALSHAATLHDAGVVPFRAGLAPWHDDREVLLRLARRIDPHVPVVLLESAHVFDICALLAHSAAYLGTSLHGWIVADAFGVPAHCLVASGRDKAAAYLDTWSGGRRQWRTLAEPDLVPGLAAASG